MAKNRFIYILVLLGTFIFFLAYKMWLSWLCLMLVLLIPIVSLIAFLITATGYKVRFKPPEKIFIGSDADVFLYGKPKKILMTSDYKVYLSITDMMSGEKKDYLIKGHGNIDVTLSVNTEHCGCFSYDISKVRLYDLLGLFSLKVKSCKNAEVVVWPNKKIAPLNSSGQRSKRLIKTNNPSAEIYEVKEYTYGDPLKSIHWKASAKKDMLLVKESYEEKKDHKIVTIPLCSDRTLVDKRLGECLFVSTQFLNHDVAHKVSVVSSGGSSSEYMVKNYRDLDIVFLNVLKTTLPKEASV